MKQSFRESLHYLDIVVPEAVVDLDVMMSEIRNTINVFWKAPKQRDQNGRITKYYIHYGTQGVRI